MNENKRFTIDSSINYYKPLHSSTPVISTIREAAKKKDNKGYGVSIITADSATRRVLAPYIDNIRPPPKRSQTLKKLEKRASFYLSSDIPRCLPAFLDDVIDLPSLVDETANVLKIVTKSLGVTVYLVDPIYGEIYQRAKTNVKGHRHRVSWKIGEGKTIAAYVAHCKEYVMVDDILGDMRFPEGLGWRDTTVKSVLCAPVVTPDNNVASIIELYRDLTQGVYEKTDLQIVGAVSGWMGAAMHQNEQRLALQKQHDLNDQLLQLTTKYFADVVATEKIISEIVLLAKISLEAERGSFFLLDKEQDELVADYFDEGIDNSTGEKLHRKKQKIRFSKERGIAGTVARTGETINVIDAYSDPRFNKEVDLQTGFITRSILCMPISGEDEVLGVVQLLNKKNGAYFTKTDEYLFQTFSVYCALALNYTRVQEQMIKVDLINAINSEMLTYHLKPCIHDRSRFLQAPRLEVVPRGFNTFSWYLTGFEDQLSKLVLCMLRNVLGSYFEDSKHIRYFILMVKKSYRKNPYHNFDHAFNVCHCMYNILRRNMDIFSPLEAKALLISALCHDVDHPGYTNNFLQLTNHNLTQLYPDSCLENHHFRITMLNVNACKIFTSLPAPQYKELVEEIHDAIIATDLALYFRSRSKLLTILDNQEFEWPNMNHRALVKSIMMTSCDLSGQCKPFPTAKKITESLYREFYRQGDIEKELGFLPLSMMDREKQGMIPDDQVKFIDIVCLPCAELLREILPNTEELYIQCKELRNHWAEIIEMRTVKNWKPEESYVHK